MNAFVKRIAVLSVLWALCEILLPSGKHRQLVSMTASLLVMTAILASAAEWVNGTPAARTTLILQTTGNQEESYRRTILTSAANQLQSSCIRLANRTGYRASASVWLTLDGAVSRIEMTLAPEKSVLLTPEDFAQALSQQLGVERNCIILTVEDP